MLLEFSCSNHRSIRDEITFSAMASKDTTFEEKTKEISCGRVLRSAIIYGANAAGKSNLIDAIAFMQNLVLGSINFQPGIGIRNNPHKLEGYSKPSTYKIQFVSNDVRYAFGFTLKETLVSEEYLYCFPNNRQAVIYEREEESFVEGSRFKGKFSSCKDVLKPNRLLLSCAANFSSIAEIASAFNFFRNELVVYNPGSQSNWLNYSLHQLASNSAMKDAVLTFLSELGTGIKDVNITIDKQKLDPASLPPFLADEFKAALLQNDFDSVTPRIVYENMETDLMEEESAGIKKLFGILCPLIDIMFNGKVLICDELEDSLHESLLYGLVEMFMNAQSSEFSQMIFTTHETGILNLGLFRRDQIWFAEMDPQRRATDIYSLAEIKNVRKEDNFGRGYISGKYGAIPMLNLDFAKIVSKMN